MCLGKKEHVQTKVFPYYELKSAVKEMVPDLGNSIQMFKGLPKVTLGSDKD